MKITVGTRGSNLALTQTKWVVHELKKAHPEMDIEIKVIQTRGDQIKNTPLNEIGDKGLFVKEIEAELLKGNIDFAVHSMKDMPSDLPEGLCFGPSPKREDPRDVLVTPHSIQSIEQLPHKARIGTGSQRRGYQLQWIRKDLIVEGIRGNVETRIRKMFEQTLDGIILAAAGLKRIGLFTNAEYGIIPFSLEEMIPAPTQGVLALELRIYDKKTYDLLNSIADENTNIQSRAERTFLEQINGNCHTPMGAYCHIQKDESVQMHGFYGSEDGEYLLKKKVEGAREDVEKLAGTLAVTLREELRR